MIHEIGKEVAWCLAIGLSPFSILLAIYTFFTVQDIHYWQRDNERMWQMTNKEDQEGEEWKDE